MQNIIKQRARILGLSLGQVSRKANISRRSMTRISKGETEPLISTAYRISKAMDCKIEELWIFED